MSSSPHIFISYSRQDVRAAEALYESLNQAGKQAWLDVARLEKGKDWWESIVGDGIHPAGVFILLASPWALGSEWVQKEWAAARAAGAPKRFIVVLLQTFPRRALSSLTAFEGIRACECLDISARPLVLERLVLAALDGKSTPQTLDEALRRQSRALPAIFGLRPLPFVSRAAAILMSGLGMVGLLVVGTIMLIDAALQLILANSYGIFGSMFRLLFAVLFIVLIYCWDYAWESLRHGWLTFRRIGSWPQTVLLRLVTGGILLSGFFAASTFVALVALGPGTAPDLSERDLDLFILVKDISLGAAVALLLISIMAYLAARWFSPSRTLKRWLLYDPPQLQQSLSRQSKAEDQLRSRSMQPWQVLTPFDAPRPVRAVQIAAAPQDAPYARFLGDFLRRTGVQVVTAAPDLNLPLLAILSDWAWDDQATTRILASAIQGGRPLLPILLRETGIPAHMSSLNRLQMISVNENVWRSLEEVARTLSGNAGTADTSIDWRSAAKPAFTLPRWAVITFGIMIASAIIKFMIVVVGVPTAILQLDPVSMNILVASLALALIWVLQALMAGGFVKRWLPAGLLLIAQLFFATFGTRVLVDVASGTHFLQTVGWPLPRESLFLVLVLELLPLALLAIPAHRAWAAGGFRLRPLAVWRAGASYVRLLWPGVLAALIVILPPLLTGALAQPILTEGGVLTFGQSVLARTDGESHHEWRFESPPGALVSIEMQAINWSQDPILVLLGPNDERLTNDDGAGRPNAGWFGLHLPDGGAHVIETWPGGRGTYRLTLSAEVSDERGLITCDQTVSAAITRAALAHEWRFRARPRDTVSFTITPDIPPAASSYLLPSFAFYAPDGTLLDSAAASTSASDLSLSSDLLTLRAGGDHRIRISGDAEIRRATTGSYSLTLHCG